MDTGRRKAGVNSIVSGSVWESRMKMDEVKGGIKVFNVEDGRAINRAMSKRITSVTDSPTAVSGKRKVLSLESSEGSEKSPSQIQGRKMRSEGSEEKSVAVVKIEKSPIQIRKSKSEVIERNEKPPIRLRKVKSESVKMIVDDNAKAIVLVGGGIAANSESEIEKGIDGSMKDIEKPHVENESSCKEFEVCHISTNSNQINSAQKDENEEEDIEIEESFDIKEINLPEPRKVMNEVKKFHQFYEKPTFKSEEYHSFHEKNTKLQSLVDLIMWKEVSRSAFVFGIGSFVITSSSYAKDINISFISVISYVGLFYLAATFLYRSIICRGAIDMENIRHVVGEEEAIWVMKLVLPYLNEFLLKLRALFCGDPATTMKLAVLLFALARCGSSITVWKVAKWGFFGVFTVPKVCSSYSSQLSAYAKFWVRRFRDAWESCSQKKGVAVAIFLLVWNLSSLVARIWAAFMLFVAFRYYQQSLLTSEDLEEDEVEEDEGMTTAKQKKKF